MKQVDITKIDKQELLAYIGENSIQLDQLNAQINFSNEQRKALLSELQSREKTEQEKQKPIQKPDNGQDKKTEE